MVSRRASAAGPCRGIAEPACPYCGTTTVIKDGRANAPFASFRWPQEIITAAVRGACLQRLTAADVRDLLAEWGGDLDAHIVLTQVQPVGPLLANTVRHQARKLGARWWCDATHTTRWTHLQRVIEERGQGVDLLPRAHRDLDCGDHRRPPCRPAGDHLAR